MLDEPSAKPPPPPHLDYGEQDENGVDVSLIRENLRLTPKERLLKGDRARHDALRLLEHGRNPDRTEKSALELIAEVLLAHGVEFIVVGEHAELLHGKRHVLYVVQLCYRRAGENLQRLAEALQKLKPTPRSAPPDRPFRVDAQTLEMGMSFAFRTPIVDLELLGYVEPLGEYDAIAKHAETYQVGDVQLRVISLDDLIAIKQHINRPKDRESLMQLLTIKRLREQRS